MSKGLLISFEGLDGSGKSTQVELLSNWLQDQDITHTRTLEPGGTWLGMQVRQILFSESYIIDPLAEALLFQADRAQHFSYVVLPALKRGDIVITDRCFDSNMVYQGLKSVDMELIQTISAATMHNVVPDLTILLDLPAKEVHKIRKGAKEITRFDREATAFHDGIRSRFLSLAANNTERIKVVDASISAKAVHIQVVKLVEELLAKR